MIKIKEYIEIYNKNGLIYKGECFNKTDGDYNYITIGNLDELIDIGMQVIILRNELGEELRTAFVDTSNKVGDITIADRRFRCVYQKIDILLYEKRID